MWCAKEKQNVTVKKSDTVSDMSLYAYIIYSVINNTKLQDKYVALKERNNFLYEECH